MKKLSKIISIVIVLALFLQISVFATDAAITVTSVVEDPIENIVLVNASLSTGPEHALSFITTNEAGDIVYPESARTGEGGAFSLLMNVANFEDGDYSLKITSDDGAVFTYDFSIPFAAAPTPIEGTVSNAEILMETATTVNANKNTFDINLSNAFVSPGAISAADYVVTGLPEGLELALEAVEDNKISATLSGTATADITEEKTFTIKLKSSIILGGGANTASGEIGPATIIPSSIAKKVILEGQPIARTIKMNNKFQPNTSSNSFEVKVIHRDIETNNIWTAVVGEGNGQYEYVMPSAMEGMSISAVANKRLNTILFTLEGTAKNGITEDQTVSIVVKGGAANKAVVGTTTDSEPIVVTIKANNTDVSEGSVVTPGTGGGGAGTTPSAPSITEPNGKPADIDPIIPEQPQGFTDIKGHWGETYINYLYQRGIVQGVSATAFEPDRNITRAEFIAMIVRGLDLKIVKYNNSFSDVYGTDWYADIVETALANDLITLADNFRPNDMITREEMTKMTVAAWLASNEAPDAVAKANFSDYSAISGWAEEYVDLSVQIGLIKGNNENKFLPRDNATRAESATIITRLLTQ